MGIEIADKGKARSTDGFPAGCNGNPTKLNPRTPGKGVRAPERANWSEEERDHHKLERTIWKASTMLSAVIVIGAGASAWFTYQSAYEARRQADIAKANLVASSRAWLQFDSGPVALSLAMATYNTRGKVIFDGHSFSREGVITLGSVPQGRLSSLDPGLAKLEVTWSVKAYGNSPALKTRPEVWYGGFWIPLQLSFVIKKKLFLVVREA